MANVTNPGVRLYNSQYGGEQPIPPEFIAAMERVEETQQVPNSTALTALSDTVVESRLETEQTNERKLHVVKKKAGNIVLLAIRTTDQGQPVQVTLTLHPTGTAPSVPSATQNVAVKDLGNGWSIMEVGVEGSYTGGGGAFVPGVFGANLYGRERPNLVPEKFRPSIPTVTTRVDSAGTAVDPTLSGDELRETQEQITAFKKRITIDTQASPSVPVALTEYETTNARQLATVVETLEAAGTAAAAVTSLVTVDVKNLGNGQQVQRTSTVASLFPQTASGQRQAIVLPDKFKQAGATLVTTGTTSAGTAATPTALGTGGTGVVESNAQRVDATKVRVEDTTLTASVNTSVQEYGYYEGLVAPVTTTYGADNAAAPTSSLLTTSIRREVIGGGKAVQNVETVAAWPTQFGQELDHTTMAILPWTETTVALGASGAANTEVRPIDYVKQKVRLYDLTAIKAAYSAFALGVADYAVIDLPPVLTAITANYTADAGSGVHDETGSAASTGTTISLSLALNGSSQGSASVSPFVAPQIKTPLPGKLPVRQYFCYMDGSFTEAQLRTKLAGASFANAAVSAWPAFKPVPITILAKTRKVSGRAEAAASTAYGAGTDRVDATVSTGQSKSVEISTGVQVIQIPPTLHANLVGSMPVDATTSFSAIARVNLVGSGGPASSDSGTATTGTLTAAGGFSYTSMAATTGYTDWPATGLYLYDVQTAQSEFGQVLVRAIVFDFASIP